MTKLIKNFEEESTLNFT